jgi:hypothetical protein
LLLQARYVASVLFFSTHATNPLFFVPPST